MVALNYLALIWVQIALRVAWNPYWLFGTNLALKDVEERMLTSTLASPRFTSTSSWLILQEQIFEEPPKTHFIFHPRTLSLWSAFNDFMHPYFRME